MGRGSARSFATAICLSMALPLSVAAQNSFGQQSQQGGFGQQSQQGGFGQQSQQGGFGQQSQQGGFGQQSQQGGFGQQSQQGGFGQQAQQGGFGQQSQQGGFGQQSQQGGFGQQSQQGGFGQQSQQGGFGQQSQQGGFGQQPTPQQPGGLNPQYAQMLDQMAQYERQDFGVPASAQLHSGPMHGPTPASIPGGQIITTKGLVELIQSQRTPYVLFDVLGGPTMMAGATSAVQAAQPGRFDDQISQQMKQFLDQNLQGNTQIPLIFYCQSVQCWMSYNASLRAINLGYTNVLWYRGGIEAWQHAGGPTMPAPRQ